MSETVTCTVCGEDVGKGPGGLGIASHAQKHRREYREQVGKWPSDYQDVRDRLGTTDPASDAAQATLWESVTDEAQRTFPLEGEP